MIAHCINALSMRKQTTYTPSYAYIKKLKFTIAAAPQNKLITGKAINDLGFVFSEDLTDFGPVEVDRY